MKEAQEKLIDCIKKVATGQDYSRDISREDACEAMQWILSGEADQIQAAVFLIALRMKRETPEENLGLQDAIRDSVTPVIVEVEDLCALSDPYDGLLRSLPVSVLLPATLAACGLPAYSHGVKSIGPKYGVTHASMLAALGYDSEMSGEQVAAQLADPDIGWAYIGMEQFNPALYKLKDLRERMIKRTALSTIDRALSPLQARKTNILITGHVHKAYPDIYLGLAKNAGYQRALTYRGYEGGLIPPLHQNIELYGYLDEEGAYNSSFDPKEYGVNCQVERVTSNGIVLDQLRDSGLAALQGSRNTSYQSLVIAGALALIGAGRELQPSLAIERVRAVLDSGAVLARFERALQVSAAT